MKKSEMLSVKVGEEIEHIEIDLSEKELGKIEKLKKRLQEKRERVSRRKLKRKD